jgi:hypothetical protein
MALSNEASIKQYWREGQLKPHLVVARQVLSAGQTIRNAGIRLNSDRHSGEKVEQLTETKMNERRLRTTSTLIFSESCLRHL